MQTTQTEPQINSKDSEQIMQEIAELIPTYLPQWQLQNGEAGWAIAKVFADICEDLIQTANQVPHKLFISYLDKLGFVQSPPLASNTYVTFNLVKKFSGNVHIPKRTQLETQDKINFETQDTFDAGSAQLLSVIESFKDLYTDHSIRFLENKKPIDVFQKNKDGKKALFWR